MFRLRAIALLERVSRAQIEREPLEGRELVEATMALGVVIAVLKEGTTDRDFDAIARDVEGSTT